MWCIFILWKDWNAPYIVKRRRILVVLLLSMLFLGNVITASLWIPAKFFKIMFKLAPNLRFVSEIPFVLIMSNFFAIGQWLLYYVREISALMNVSFLRLRRTNIKILIQSNASSLKQPAINAFLLCTCTKGLLLIQLYSTSVLVCLCKLYNSVVRISRCRMPLLTFKSLSYTFDKHKFS